ncbi:hypothetical protein B0T16DRAFT_457544 [Cercophora newfieldiana]|uniref:J domain-containing protein n=1 Tax=Cercophora newfieldiana TaxID=92897 RepID=A0AA39Y3V4_9PEZI|nr:hypothetical protein B0T16DRAFT_457544 [Cercophora newfieldiana]
MVKPDYSRDYYADLDLPASADVTEIKKQFRKLALKYHPDRNPGKEDAAKDKFLVIQAAHEILTDVSLKAKYDANRTRSKFPAASGVRGNPYSNVAKDVSEQWGAPPRRKPDTPTAARPASSRYSSWAPPPQAKPKQDSAYDHLRAWDRMRSAGHRAAAAATGAAAAATGKTPRPQPKADAPPPPPRTAYQARQQEASFGTRKATGFAPQSPLGDEPPVKNQHYARTYTNVFEQTAANLKKGNARAADPNVDPLSEQFGETFLDNRQRTPYASHVGEKTNPFEGASTTRARSVRESWRKTQESDEEKTPERPQRQRSASVGESESKKQAQENTPFNGFNAVPNLRFPSQASARYSPRPAGPQTAPLGGGFPFPTSASSAASAASSANATVNGGSSQTNGPNVYDPLRPIAPWPLKYSSFLQSQPKAKPPGEPPSRPFPSYLDPLGKLGPLQTPHWNVGGFKPSAAARSGAEPDQDSSVPSKKRKPDFAVPPSGEARPPGKRLNAFERSLDAQLQELLKKPTPKEASTGAGVSAEGSNATIGKKANKGHFVRFTVPDDDDDDIPPSAATQQARFMRNSTDNINTRFVSEEKAGESYMFNAGGAPLSEDAFMKAKQRSRSTPRGRQSPQRAAFSSSTESFTNGTNAAPKPSGFDAEEWTEKIGPHNFVPPKVTRTSASPTRQTRTAKKPKPVRMTAGTAGLVDEEHTSEEDRPHPSPSPANVNGAPSPIPMDIDTPEPAPTPAQTQPSGARNINVEPSKPEWRAGDLNTKQSGGAKLGDGPTVTKPHPNTAGSEDTDDFLRPMFADFQKVEPFAPKATGLGSFGDMKTNLPFDSKPSVKIPIQKEEQKEVTVTVPTFPICPPPPPALAVALRPSAAAWKDYVINFTKYLDEWNKIEKQIHGHFVARDRRGEQAGAQRFAWVNMRGDQGCEQYLRHLQEDRFIRQEWAKACDVHEQRVRDYVKYREKMKQAMDAA